MGAGRDDAKAGLSARRGAQVKGDAFLRPVAAGGCDPSRDGRDRMEWLIFEFAPPDPGPYKVMAQASLGEKKLGEGQDALAVRAVGPELADALVRPELLEQIAKVTGGRSYRLPQSGLPRIPLLDPPVVEVGRSKDQPLWDRWYYLAVLAVLLGAEWFARSPVWVRLTLVLMPLSVDLALGKGEHSLLGFLSSRLGPSRHIHP